MSEKPLERLNYYNGQRLTASELKREQEYHIRVRRWLNKSLYSPGIARGLEVRAEKPAPGSEAPPIVVISPGLALDAEGREIILWEEAREPVTRRHHPRSGVSEAEVEGPYLVIRYNEELTAEEHESCSLQAGGYQQSAARPAWGGPSRIRAKPAFDWRDFLPHESSGEIVLAQIELDDGCREIRQINVGVRRYVGAASAAKVRQYALEGEREVAYIPKASLPDPKPDKDVVVPGRIYFHIRGRQPNAVTLYLKAEEFCVLHYTELGEHNHSATVAGSTESASPPLSKLNTLHKHLPGTLEASEGPRAAHSHDLIARKGYIGRAENLGRAAFFLIERDWAVSVSLPTGPLPFPSANVAPETDSTTEDILDDVAGTISGGGGHSHTITGSSLDNDGFDYDHKHTLSGTGSTGPQGAKDPAQPHKKARTGKPLDYVDGLEIWIGKDNSSVDHTDSILGQLADAAPTDWGGKKRLGDGTGNHVLKEKGTGPIRLDFLPDVHFTVGEHYIELRVPVKLDVDGKTKVPNGGRILYNLYIE